ncbi:6003_t:CDS:2 [Funneliformis geosporum]|nr:6003_t:CDS:2 [Funneliformis geosporum]
MLNARPESFTNLDTKSQEADKLSKIARLETTIQELTQAKTQISQQTQTDFQTQNKGTQTDLTAEQITQLETNNQNLLKLLQATEQELTNTKNQLTEKEKLNQEQIKQLESKIKLLEQQKENYQTKYDKSIEFIKEIREDVGDIDLEPLLSSRDFLQEALQVAENKFEIAGTIQAFEVCYELT